jgi:hypothetical protein
MRPPHTITKPPKPTRHRQCNHTLYTHNAPTNDIASRPTKHCPRGQSTHSYSFSTRACLSPPPCYQFRASCASSHGVGGDAVNGGALAAQRAWCCTPTSTQTMALCAVLHGLCCLFSGDELAVASLVLFARGADGLAVFWPCSVLHCSLSMGDWATSTIACDRRLEQFVCSFHRVTRHAPVRRCDRYRWEWRHALCGGSVVCVGVRLS